MVFQHYDGRPLGRYGQAAGDVRGYGQSAPSVVGAQTAEAVYGQRSSVWTSIGIGVATGSLVWLTTRILEQLFSGRRSQ